jgi:hypothetical protein
MKIALNIVGAIGVFFGVLWILQGLKILPGVVPISFMTGQTTWVGNGAFLLLFAALLLVWNNRTPKPKA